MDRSRGIGDGRNQGHRGLLLVGIVLMAINLRAMLTGIGPLIGEIRADTGISAVAAGFLGTVPVLCFGIFSVFAPRLGRRFGLERTICLVLVVLVAGILVRLSPAVALLFLGTGLIGLALATANVILPAIVKRSFPQRVKQLSSLYVAILSVTASIAAAIAIPLSETGLGWRGSLAVWAIPAAIALVVWTVLARRRTVDRSASPPKVSLRQLFRSRLAVAVTLFMAAQSFGFYIVLTWLTEILIDSGIDRSAAGLIFAGSQLISAVPIVGLSLFSHRIGDDRILVVAAGAATISGVLILALFGSSAAVLGAALTGIGQGSAFALALTFFASRAGDEAVAAELSGAGQSVAYLLAAGGPVLAGLIHGLTDAWEPVLGLVAVAAAVQLGIGFVAGRPETIGHSDLTG